MGLRQAVSPDGGAVSGPRQAAGPGTWWPEALVVGAVAAVAALAAARAGCEPTGMRSTDVVLTASLAALVVVLGARATPLALAVGAGVAAVAGQAVGLRAPAVLALALTAGAAVLDRRDRPTRRSGLAPGGPGEMAPAGRVATSTVTSGAPRPAGATRSWLSVALRAVAALLAVQVLLRVPFIAPARGSAVVALLGLAPMVWSGWRRLAPSTRRRSRPLVGVLVAVAALGGATGVAAALATTSDLRQGADAADAGLDAVRDGDQDGAEVQLHRATADLTAARDTVRAWWALPARHVPLVAPQLRALDAIADSAAEAAGRAAAGSERIDSDRLGLIDGRLDPKAVADVGPLLADVAAGSAKARRRLSEDGVRSVWHVGPVRHGLDRVADSLGDAEGSARTGVLAAELAPALLGAERQARYFVAFVSPSEARGTGFLGGYGLLTVDEGQVDLAVVGRNKDLNAAGSPDKVITGPPDYLRRYSRFEPASTWENVTFTPDGPTAAQIMAELYAQSGGGEVDGVLRIDPTGLSRLLRITGPVVVEGLADPVDATNVVSFLQVEQYRAYRDRDERIELLSEVASAVFDALTEGRRVTPARLARAVGPAVRGGHLSLWLATDDGSRLVERLGASAAVPAVRGDGFGVVTQNAGGGKIDAFLQRRVHYRATIDAGTGEVRATAEVELENNAPSSGEPPYLIGNLVGAAPGTNRMWLSVYSPLDLTSAEVGGQAVALSPDQELGRNVWSAFVEVPPGTSTTVTVGLAGRIDLSSGRYRFDLLPQAMTRPDQVEVEVAVRGGTLERRRAAPAPDGGVEVVDGGLRAQAPRSEGTWTVVADLRRTGSG